jgi:hypothetical protein
MSQALQSEATNANPLPSSWQIISGVSSGRDTSYAPVKGERGAAGAGGGGWGGGGGEKGGCGGGGGGGGAAADSMQNAAGVWQGGVGMNLKRVEGKGIVICMLCGAGFRV